MPRRKVVRQRKPGNVSGKPKKVELTVTRRSKRSSAKAATKLFKSHMENHSKEKKKTKVIKITNKIMKQVNLHNTYDLKREAIEAAAILCALMHDHSLLLEEED